MQHSAKLLFLLAVSLILRPTLTVASFDCVTDCMQRSGCWSGGSVSTPERCRDMPNLCNIQCRAQGKWGAIAYSRTTGASGYSYGWSDEAKAKQVALANCTKNGAGCQLWATYENGCGAVAADGNIVTWGSASAKPTADQRALSECSKAGGRKCAIQVSQCSR
jgi:hypothetical protein